MKLPSVLTHREARASLAGLVGAMSNDVSATVVVDASALTRFDSSALAVLLACRREALVRGSWFSVCGAPVRLQRLSGLYGLKDVLHWVD